MKKEQPAFDGGEAISLSNKPTLISLYTRQGQRKYLTQQERERFIDTASYEIALVFAFCCLLSDTGCRISEALALTPKHIDHADGVIVIECLKKRQHGIYRAIPVSPRLLNQLTRLTASLSQNERIWPWCRMTGYRRVKSVMKQANITGPQASPKGLRHSFAIAAISAGVPLNLVQRWLGHADMATTAIYTHVVGNEEKQIAEKMWRAWQHNDEI